MSSFICLVYFLVVHICNGLVGNAYCRHVLSPVTSVGVSRVGNQAQVILPSVRRNFLLRMTDSNVEPTKERTYIMIKPDGVQRRLVGEIINRFEEKGYLLKGLKLVTPSADTLSSHYKDLQTKGFFPKLMTYMSSGPVVAMVWEGRNAVKTGRVMLGATNPLDSAPGTIRGDFAVEVGRNVCHGSDSVESAEREIGLWFPEGLNEYASHSNAWIYE